MNRERKHHDHVAKQWESYARDVLPPGCSQVQRTETKRAFYAGAQALLMRILARLSPDAEPTEEDMFMMHGIEHELSQFAADVAAGKE